MSRLARERIPTILLMVLAVCVYVCGGVMFRSQPIAGASGNGRIAFSGADDQSDMQIYTMNADGSDVRQLTNDVNQNYMPAWSPDGANVAYAAGEYDGKTGQIVVMRANGSHKVNISNDANNQSFMVAWSPDGAKLVYASQPSNYSTEMTISTMNADGSNKTALTDGSSQSYAPVWSPDGNTIAFICLDLADVLQVCTMDTDGSNKQQITSGTSVDYTNVAYSPDGSKLAYATISRGGGYIQHLGTMDTNGANPQTITTQNTSVADVSWSPDGSKLIYDNYDADETVQRVYYINLDGSDETVISPDNQYAFLPSWQAASASDYDGDGTPNSTETPAPNNGDANGDGIADQYQAHVTSIVNPVTGKYVSVESNCASNVAVSADAPPTIHADTAFQYPAGLISFTLNCDDPGDTATVTHYIYGVTKANTMVLRKYNSLTHVYTTLSGATFTGVTIGGQTATKIVYQITDGGPFDQDGSANGIIVDPVGLAIPLVGAPNTGMGGGTFPFPRSLAAPLS